ncbi:MAG: RagB/SusD family nutrient uptake outer membrane protein [Proteiniphilum sp.]
MNIKKYIYFGLLVAILSSCEKYLEPKLTNDYGDEITWKLPDYARATIMEAYNDIHQTVNSYDGNNYLDAITDNSLTTQSASNLYQYVFGSQTVHSDPLNRWGTAYNNIAIVNRFLEKGLSPDIIYYLSDSVRSESLRTRTKGEAYFLRAWWQMELLRLYGGLSKDGRALGYIIVTRTFTEEERETVNSMPRDDYELCAQQIFADCDTAFKYLPLQFNVDPSATSSYNDPVFGAAEFGRATGKAALALKSRVALLAASPAYQPQSGTQYAISEDSIQKKWLRAAVFAQEALTKGQMGSLSDMVALDNDILVGDNVTNPNHAASLNEILFRRYANNRSAEQNHFPAMWFGLAKCNPSQNLVNAYPMANGYPITDSRSGYDAQNPYAGRDGRFIRQINYNGSRFNNQSNQRELQIYSTAADGTIGMDAPGYDYRNTWTGYYIRKGMSVKLNINYNPDNPGATANDHHCNPLLRRAEVWMNLAEALNELAGPTGSVAGISETSANIIKRIRALYGTGNAYVDEVATLNNKEMFRELILNERRLEFAFENMRLWDIRRWRMSQMNEPILGIKIYKDINNKYVYFGTNPGVDDIVVQTRALSDNKYYTSPIPYAELIKNRNLIQNAGWE